MSAKDTLKLIMDDKTKFADNLVVTLASGETVSLGDLRGLTADQQSAIASRETKIATAQAELTRNMETLHLAQAETARLFAEVSAAKDAGGKGGDKGNEPDPLEALERDPVIGPIAKTIRQQQALIDSLTNKQIKPIAEAMSRMAQAYVDDRVADVYDRSVPEAARATTSLEAVLKHATDNKLFTRSGVPDIRKAYLEMSTKPMTQADIDKQLADAREAGRKEATDAARVRIPRPGLSITGSPSNAADQPFKPKNLSSVSGALEEAIAAAAKDASIWAAVDNVQ